MKLEAPYIAHKLFSRLCKGENLLLSRNGPSDDAQLFEQVETDEEACRKYFAVLGFHLQRGDNCYYFTSKDQPRANIEKKLDRIVKLVRVLDFFSSNIESFSEGQIFSATELAARCNGDTKAERFLQHISKGNSNSDRLERLLQSWVRQGYLSAYDQNRQEYKVLSSVNYIFSFVDRIEIQGDDENPEILDAQA